MLLQVKSKLKRAFLPQHKTVKPKSTYTFLIHLIQFMIPLVNPFLCYSSYCDLLCFYINDKNFLTKLVLCCSVMKEGGKQFSD